MGPSPGVSGGEESGMKTNNQVVLMTESTKRQRRPSVRLGEPSDHPASIILLNPPKKRKLEEEDEEEDEEDREQEQQQDKEKDKKLDDEEMLDHVQEDGDEYHDVPVQGDFAFPTKVIQPKPRTRTLEHVASIANQSQRKQDAAVSATLAKPVGSGEPVVSPKDSPVQDADVEQQADGEQVHEQVTSPVQVQTQREKPSSGTRRQPLNNGLGRRGKSRRGGRRGGSGAPYKSIGGILQARKRPKDGKEGKINEDEDLTELKADGIEKLGSDAPPDDKGPNDHTKEESPFQDLPPLPPTGASGVPPLSDKEIESSERGTGSSEGTESSLDDKMNGEEVPLELPQPEQEHGVKEKAAVTVILPVPSSSTSPVVGGRGGRKDGVKHAEAPCPEAVRVEHKLDAGRTVGEISLHFLRRAVNSFPGGVSPWLAALGLGHLAEVFEQNEVDAVVLPLLTMEDLTEMRIPTGPKRKMFSAIQVLREAVL